MKFSSQYISYKKTGVFSKIVEDYVSGDPALKDFYVNEPDMRGIRKAIKERKKYKYNRNLLVKALQDQYSSLKVNEQVQFNIESLLSENTFTICTAHQPNIFTGHLYFIYKILHAVKLADKLNNKIKGCHFVPVYYMGSEDADLEELGEVTVNDKRYEWKTAQKGAVGRMKVDKAFIGIINEIEAQLSIEKYGNEIIDLVRSCYQLNRTIEQATFELVHQLFKEYGLVVLLPDNADLKRAFYDVSKKELTEKFSQTAVVETLKVFPEKYKVQVAGRDINLFYLKDNIRERIEPYKDGFAIANSNITFSKEEIFQELKEFPERFSPNVILRPVFQELILPNVVFIGGGGELAYWLELKAVFEAVNVPYPVLILRNSFMIVKKGIATKIVKLKFDPEDFFKPNQFLIDTYVKTESKNKLYLEAEKALLSQLYEKISSSAKLIDTTLANHVAALKVQALNKVSLLEKKMLKAEKKKFEAGQRQINLIKSALFPRGNLQERVDNIMPFYALWGNGLIKKLYDHSNTLEQEFCIVEEQ